MALLTLHNESSFSNIHPSDRDRLAAATCPLQPLILALKPSCHFTHSGGCPHGSPPVHNNMNLEGFCICFLSTQAAHAPEFISPK